MKKSICLLLCITVFMVVFSGCGTTQLNYGLYTDAISALKQKNELQLQIKQKITSVISGGSFETASGADVKIINLKKSPVFDITGHITAIGANVSYKMHYENGVCDMDLYGEEIQTKGDLAEILQEKVGLSVKSVSLNKLLNFSEEEMKACVLQTKDNMHYLSLELKADTFGQLIDTIEGETSPVVVTFCIDLNRCLTGITVATGINTNYAEQNSNIYFVLEFAFQTQDS